MSGWWNNYQDDCWTFEAVVILICAVLMGAVFVDALLHGLSRLL